MKNKKELTSGKLQDIEANLKLVKEEGNLSYKFHKASLPSVWRYTRKEWIKILEFERKQELDRLKFFNNLQVNGRRVNGK